MSISEKDAVLRERAAYVAGLAEACWRDPATRDRAMLVAAAEAAEMFPLPTVTRPRVGEDPHTDGFWSVRPDDFDGEVVIHHSSVLSHDFQHWSPDIRQYVTPERAALFTDLFANPTETVDA